MTTKKISFENTMLDTLKGINYFRTIDELITETARFGEPDWTRKQVATTVNRLIRKGINIKVRDARSPKVSYKYEVAEELFVSTDPMEAESLDQPLDAVLDRVQTITKPVDVEDAPDLFSDEVDIPTNDENTADEIFLEEREGYSPIAIPADLAGYPYVKDISKKDPINDVYSGIADILMKMETERKYKVKPEPSTTSLMHFILSNKPRVVTVNDVRGHYGLNLADAMCLLVRTGEKHDCLNVNVKIKGFAL